MDNAVDKLIFKGDKIIVKKNTLVDLATEVMKINNILPLAGIPFKQILPLTLTFLVIDCHILSNWIRSEIKFHPCLEILWVMPKSSYDNSIKIELPESVHTVNNFNAFQNGENVKYINGVVNFLSNINRCPNLIAIKANEEEIRHPWNLYSGPFHDSPILLHVTDQIIIRSSVKHDTVEIIDRLLVIDDGEFLFTFPKVKKLRLEIIEMEALTRSRLEQSLNSCTSLCELEIRSCESITLRLKKILVVPGDKKMKFLNLNETD